MLLDLSGSIFYYLTPMDFAVTILGSTSPFPTKGRFTTAQVLQIRGDLLMIDCGEAAQIQLEKYQIRRSKIKRIFISHLHGDHYFGLFGLLGSFRMTSRSEPLHIHCPPGLDKMIALELELSNAYPYPFDIVYHFTQAEQTALIFENKDYTVHSFPLQHGHIATTGFLFKEKSLPPNMRKDKIMEYNIPFQQIPAIKSGADYVLPDGTIILNQELTTPPPPARSYAYCSDTAYFEEIIPTIKHVDLLYHDTTFGAEIPEDNAALKVHANTLQSATIAKKAQAKQLIIGHFSARYNNLSVLLNEAQSIFPATHLATEGSIFTVEAYQGDDR